MMVELSNGIISAGIDPVGAELKRLVFGGRDYIFRGNANDWKGSAPFLFPICSGLRDDSYYAGGKKYSIGKHGFARFMEFSCEKTSGDTAVFVIRETDDTLARYPFPFEVRVSYEIKDACICVKYSVKNTGKTLLPFSVGAHEGYYCPEGIEDYEVVFPQKEQLVSSVLEGNLLGRKTVMIAEDSDILPLKYDYFAVDALVFEHLVSKSAVLRNRRGGHGVKVTFEGFPYFLIWSKPGAPFVCLEPWCGISDRTDAGMDIFRKEGINVLEPGCVFERTHTIEVF